MTKKTVRLVLVSKGAKPNRSVNSPQRSAFSEIAATSDRSLDVGATISVFHGWATHNEGYSKGTVIAVHQDKHTGKSSVSTVSAREVRSGGERKFVDQALRAANKDKDKERSGSKAEVADHVKPHREKGKGASDSRRTKR